MMSEYQIRISSVLIFRQELRGIGGQVPGNVDDWFENDEDVSQNFEKSANLNRSCLSLSFLVKAKAV